MNASELYTKAINGQGSAIDTYIQFKEYVGQLTDMMNEVKELAIEEREKYGKERITRMGLEVDVRETTRYSYPSTFTPYAEAKAKIKRLEGLMKQAWQGEQIADAETGEMIPPAKPSVTKALYLTKPRGTK